MLVFKANQAFLTRAQNGVLMLSLEEVSNFRRIMFFNFCFYNQVAALGLRST